MLRWLGICLLIALFPAVAGAESVTVLAAVSLTNVLEQIGNVYTAKTGTKVDFNFAASGPLEMQWWPATAWC